MIQNHIGISPKWRNPEKQSTSATIINLSSQENKNNQANLFTDDEIKSSESTVETEEKTRHFCKTPSFPSNTQHCTKPTVPEPYNTKICAKGDAICIPSNYSKFDLPNELERTEVKF